MTPSQLSTQLRHIAAKISNSKSPRRDLVAKDLKRVLAALNVWEPDPVDGPRIWFSSTEGKHSSGDPETNGMKLRLIIF